jgi:tRNA G18 (ribose-2'-O)-methylase SpoU
MARLTQEFSQNGFFGIGILHTQSSHNIGTLWRTAYILGASFIFTVDKRYKKQSSDVINSWQKIPLYHYSKVEDLLKNIPHDTQLVGVEMGENAIPLADFKHPYRAIYLLGNEQNGLPSMALEKCQKIVELPGICSLNVAVAGSIVIYDRVSKIGG